MKFVVNLFAALSDVSKKDSERIYANHANFYHPIALDAIQKAMNKELVPNKHQVPRSAWM